MKNLKRVDVPTKTTPTLEKSTENVNELLIINTNNMKDFNETGELSTAVPSPEQNPTHGKDTTFSSENHVENGKNSLPDNEQLKFVFSDSAKQNEAISADIYVENNIPKQAELTMLDELMRRKKSSLADVLTKDFGYEKMDTKIPDKNVSVFSNGIYAFKDMYCVSVNENEEDVVSFTQKRLNKAFVTAYDLSLRMNDYKNSMKDSIRISDYITASNILGEDGKWTVVDGAIYERKINNNGKDKNNPEKIERFCLFDETMPSVRITQTAYSELGYFPTTTPYIRNNPSVNSIRGLLESKGIKAMFNELLNEGCFYDVSNKDISKVEDLSEARIEDISIVLSDFYLPSTIKTAVNTAKVIARQDHFNPLINHIEECRKYYEGKGCPDVSDTLKFIGHNSPSEAFSKEMLELMLIGAVNKPYDGFNPFAFLLYGTKGIGKSLFCQTLGGFQLKGMDFYSNDIQEYKGKDAPRILSRNLIVEDAEAVALKKDTFNAFKKTITQGSAEIRTEHKDYFSGFKLRATVFITSNEKGNIPDARNERRIIPIICTETPQKEFEKLWDLDFRRDIHMLLLGFGHKLRENKKKYGTPLFSMTAPFEKYIEKERQEHQYTDGINDLIEEHIAKERCLTYRCSEFVNIPCTLTVLGKRLEIYCFKKRTNQGMVYTLRDEYKYLIGEGDSVEFLN